VLVQLAKPEVRVTIATAAIFSDVDSELLWLAEEIQKSVSDAGGHICKQVKEVWYLASSFGKGRPRLVLFFRQYIFVAVVKQRRDLAGLVV